MSQWRQRHGLASLERDPRWPGKPKERGGVKVGANDVGGRVEERLDVVVFLRLHQPEMAVGQGEPRVAWNAAEHRRARRRLAGRAQHLGVRRAGHAIEHHSGHLDVAAMAGKAAHQGRNRGALAADVDHQHHRPAHERGEVGGRTATASSPVEQPHYALAYDHVGAIAESRRKGVKRFGPHGPDVEVDTVASAGGGVKRGIDVIRPDLERRH